MPLNKGHGIEASIVELQWFKINKSINRVFKNQEVYLLKHKCLLKFSITLLSSKGHENHNS